MVPRPFKMFRFRLRTILIVVTVLAILLTIEVNKVRRTRLVIDEVHRLLGQVAFAHQETTFGPFTGYDVNAKLPGPVWLRRLIGDDYFLSVSSVDFGRTDITDSDLERLGKLLATLPDLRSIQLHHTAIGDRGIESLRDCTQLESLGLGDTNVTDSAMEYVGEFSQLTSLTLWDTEVTDNGLRHVSHLSRLMMFQIHPNITDAGLAHLKDLTELEELLLFANEQVTDRGMDHLMGLINLKHLCLPESVSPEARQRLKAAIPEVVID